ncbi:MAG: outer membrane beta-barrel protein [Gammaproteobacteria bacterium]|jgi:hypothetical protein|nr:outer membrane beta-barrel protein [Gammaproteobacteria bacterium]
MEDGIRPNYYFLFALSGIIFASNTLYAAEIKPAASVTAQYTDNARKTPTNEMQDLIISTRIGTGIDAGNGPFQLEAETSLQHEKYIKDSYNDQQYFKLNASAGWEMLRDRIDWQMHNSFSQQSVNSLNPDTPDNIQDSNVFTFGTNIDYRISGRQSLTLNPEYRKFSYEIQNTDNQQTALDAGWNYQLFRTMNVGVRGGTNRVDYDDPLVTDYTLNSVHLTLSSTRSGYSYGADIGTTRVEREDDNNVQGITGNIRWSFDITGSSNLRTYIGSEITDTNSSLLDSSINPDESNFSYTQISSDALRNSTMRINYLKDDARLKSDAWIKLSRYDYEFALLDRDVQAVGIKLTYPLSAIISTGISTSYSQTELTDTPREDNEFSFGGNINYRLSRRLLATANLNYHSKDSTIETASFNELTLFARLSYGYDFNL